MANKQERNTDNIYSKNRDLVISIQEAERQRIARDLHDTSLQNLTHIIHQIELCNLYLDKDITQAKLELLIAKQGIKKVIDELREIIYDLRPMSFDDLGLKDAFENFFSVVQKDIKFEYELHIEDIDCDNDFIQISIYRIVKECVINALRHSGGNKIIFKCISDGGNCFLCIEDNGNGFSREDVDTKKNHFGISGIYERVSLLNGEISIDTIKGKGTKIIIRIPLVFNNN